ncbi:hypothetical protein E2C01_063228 [Portunus trituberculatus]|uniref:Uncharacterized protein n=1 Tax=Portunus trituberculatus TaxID=210409 RepID=A0A5B7HHJ9_PORTR|nr:hypothetical protein [Portunus trituberculatus]
MHTKSSPGGVPGNKVELLGGVSDSVSGVGGNYAINPRLCCEGPPLTHHSSLDHWGFLLHPPRLHLASSGIQVR